MASVRISRTRARAPARASAISSSASAAPRSPSAARSPFGSSVLIADLRELPLHALEQSLQVLVLARDLLLRAGGKPRARRPPVDAHLLGAVDRAHEQPQLDRDQLDVQQVYLDVSRDHDALVEHTLEDVGQVGRPALARAEIGA